MKKQTHRSLTHAIQQLLRQPIKACSAAQKHTASTALLSLLLLNQPVLVEAQVQPKFVEVPRLENPLTPPIDVGDNAKPAFADIDNDGDFDVFIGTDNSNGKVKYYENTGNVNHPIFEERTDENNPLNEVATQNGFGSNPTLIDIDNDNDLDAFIGGKNVEYYENIGNAHKPIFEQRIEEKNSLNSVRQLGSIPFFVDIDNDDDLDLFIGNYENIDDGENNTITPYGIVKYFENTGNINTPIFEERLETTYPFSRIKDIRNSTPRFVDIDNDSDMDAFLGSSDGTVRYYENTGTEKHANFLERIDQNNPLNDVNVGDSSAPAFIDIDGDSDLDAFIGTGEGTIKYYENTGTRNKPQFVERTKLDNPFGGIVDNDISLTLADIDNDGDLDAFATKYNESVKYYENIGNVNQPSFEECIDEDNPLNGVKGFSSIALLDIDADGDLDTFIGNRVEVPDERVENRINTSYNTVKYYENTGNVSQPIFEERINDANPLSRVEKDNRFFTLYFIDSDSDSDFDVFIEGDYYENVSSISQPLFVERLEQDNPVKNLGIGSDDGTPILIDANNDGNLDAFVRTPEGTIKYYENSGSISQPRFEERKDAQNPFVDVIGVGRSSIPILVDLDNDGDLEAFLESSNGIEKYYQNTSNVNQPIFERNGQKNPFAEIVVENRPFGKPALVDIDNDNDLDTFIGTRKGTINYYENTGTVNQPIFVERVKQDNPLSVVDRVIVGKDYIVFSSVSTPTLVDIDNDNDLDAFISNRASSTIGTVIRYYENIGYASEPRFVERQGPDNPLPNVNIDTFTLVDIDNDHDLDAFIGTEDGNVQYYKNIGNIYIPIFEKADTNPLAEVNIKNVENDKQYSTSSLVDIDNDGDLDAFIDLVEGTVKYYENQGTANIPNFVDRTEQYNFFGDSDLDDHNPTLVDIDSDGDLDAFIGSGAVGIKYYENTGTISQPNFVMQSEPDNPLAIIEQRFTIVTPPTLVDMDNDKDLDAFFGLLDGTIKYYENIGTLNFPVFVERTKHKNPLIDVDVERYSQPALVDIDDDNDFDAFIGAEDGTISYYENIGTVYQPRFEEKKNTNNPLVAVNMESFSRPMLVLGDIDNDGDVDAFIHGRKTILDENGKEKTRKIIHYYKNIGTPNQPKFVDDTEQSKLLAKINNLESFRSFTLLDADNDEDLDIVVTLNSSTLIYYENQGNIDGQPHFVNLNLKNSNLDNVFAPDSTLADVDNDGDLDAIKRSDHVFVYYENMTLASNALPNLYALPKSAIYPSKREISLNCIDCEKIYYTLDGTTEVNSAIEYTAPFEITANTTLNFVAIDAAGNLSEVRTERYVIDIQLPELKIDVSNMTDRALQTMTSIQGMASDSNEFFGLDRLELQIIYDPLYVSGDSNTPFSTSLTWLPIELNENWSFELDKRLPIIPDGDYQMTVRAFDKAGNVDEDTLTITIGEPAPTELYIKLNSRAILNNDTLNIKGKLNRIAESDDDLSNLPIELIITAPDGTEIAKQTKTHTNTGQYEFLELSGFTQKGKYTFQTRFAGTINTPLLAKTESTVESVLVGESAGYAIIVQGKTVDEEGLAAHNKTTNRIYHKLKERGFEEDNIYYFNYEDNQSDIVVDGIPNKKAIKNAFADLPDKMNGSPGPFYLIMVDHGGRDGEFYLENQGDNEVITPTDIADWLTTLENNLTNEEALSKPRVVILGYCYSGSFIPELSGENRVIITSAAADEPSYKGPKEPDDIRSGEFFLEELFQRLGRGNSFKEAFEKSTQSTEIYTRRGGDSANTDNPYNDDAVQHPLLDRNGDGQGSNDLFAESGDGPNLAELYLGTGAETLINAPDSAAEILGVTDTVFLTPEQSADNLYIKVNNANRVTEAPVDIRKPSLELTTGKEVEYTVQREIKGEGLIRVSGDLHCSHFTDVCEKPVDVFDEAGKYELFYFVRDKETGDISPIKRSVVYKNKEGNKAPEAANLRYPTDGASTRTSLTFQGKKTSDPDGNPVTYTLLIATDDKFDDSVVYKREELRIPSTYIDRNTIINDGRTDDIIGLKDLTPYFWKFETIDNFGARKSSKIFSFKTNNATNGGFCPELDNTGEGALSTLHVVAEQISPQIWYTADLQPDCDGIFIVAGIEEHKSKSDADKLKPNAETASYNSTNGQLKIRNKNIEMWLVPDVQPLQFKRTLNY